MYLYSTDGLGECDVNKKFSLIGSGTDPRTNPTNPKTGICPLIQDPATGAFIDWQTYLNRSINAKDRLSKFKRFREEDCYKDFQKKFCVAAPTQKVSIELMQKIAEMLTGLRWTPEPGGTPQVPPAPKTLK
jgi:hypothetical protein